MDLDRYIYSGLLQINKSLIVSFEKVDLKILIFLLLCINLLSFTLSNNEEAYLPLAKQFMDPSWMPGSFLFNEWPGNRLVFQFITGFFLKHIQFQAFVFFARLLVFLIISIPLGAIFKKLAIKNIYAVIIFQIYLLHQNYFAEEFIIGDFEPKSIAYICVIAGLYFLLENRYLLAVFFSILASYFHILVGGWFFLLIFLYSFFFTKSLKLTIKEFLLYCILLAPLVYYLGGEIAKSGSVINGVNIDWVYVYFRNAHHLAPLSMKEVLPEIIFQISVTGTLFLTTILVFRRFKGELLKRLYLLNVIVFSILFLSLGISLFDKTGFFLKFYPFRIAALGCFLMYLYGIRLLKLLPTIPPLIKSGFFIIGFYLILAAGVNTLRQIFDAEPKPELRELVYFVNHNTDKKDVFLNLDDYELSFSRITGRDEFVVYKFVPGGGQKIYEWYIRILERKEVLYNISQVRILKQKYRLNYLISDHAVDERNLLKLVFRNNRYSLYKIL